VGALKPICVISSLASLRYEISHIMAPRRGPVR
jgi:hypothetical protein